MELRRFHLAGAEEVGRLNYIIIGNPEAGKVRGQPISVLCPCHLSVHDTASHLHALPCTAVLQTSIARVWARLLGRLGLRPNADDEAKEQKALADTPAGAASAKSDDERARDALALRMLLVDAEKHGAAVIAVQLVLDTARAARDAAATYEEGIRSSSVLHPDKPGTRHKATMELRTSASLRRSGDAVTSAEAALRNAEAE